MAKKEKYPKDYISFDINLAGAKELHLTTRQISNTSKYYNSLTIHTIKKKAIDYDLILLRGQGGEVAYVRNDSYYRHRKITLITEFPLSLLAEEQRKWIALASKLFKSEFISDSEIAHYKKGFTRTDNSYRFYEGNGIKMRYKKYSDSAPYASKTTKKQDLEARNKWIKKRYIQLKRDKSLSKYSARYEKIVNELVGKTFGSLKITKRLELYTIKNILYSKPKKISD